MTTVNTEVKGDKSERRLRVLCLHGFRTSGEIIKKQLTTKWSESVLQKMDLVFVNGPFPCRGQSRVEGIFDPPYYEWFAYNEVSFLAFANRGFATNLVCVLLL